MRLRLLKRKTLFQVYERVRDLEDKYKDQIENIPDSYAEGRMGSKEFEDYAEWLGMVHALRAYGEGEDFDYYAEEIIEIDWGKTKQLSPRRMQLLNYLSENNAESINKLSIDIKRNVKNVYNDLKILEQLGFIRLIKEGKRISPELLVHEITILLW